MARENEREAIQNLQRYLRRLSYFNEEIGAVPIDGVFDRETEGALRSFQRAEGLPETGRADRDTWERLYAAFVAETEKRRAPSRIAHFPEIPENYTVEVGETQFLVSIIQHALSELSVIYDGIGEVPVSGVYDARTAEAVRAFQRAHGLPESGGVDRATWNALADAYNRNFASSYLRQ